MCSWHEDLFESAIPLSINYSTRLRSVPLLVSHHLMPLIVRFVILQDSSPFLLKKKKKPDKKNPSIFYFLSSLLPRHLSGSVRDTKENRGKRRTGRGEKKYPSRMRGNGTQRNTGLLSKKKNTSLPLSQPSILMCLHKSTQSHM